VSFSNNVHRAFFCVLFSEAGFLSKLAINAAANHIQSKVYYS
jgi:hypothetical protein